MTAKGKNTAKRLLAIEALASGATHAEASNAAVVSDRTLRRWRADASFKAELRRAVADVFADTTRALSAASASAARCLASLIDDPMTPAHARVAAALGILKHARDSIELDQMAARLDAIEQRIAAENRSVER